jgi:hypothetical protein
MDYGYIPWEFLSTTQKSWRGLESKANTWQERYAMKVNRRDEYEEAISFLMSWYCMQLQVLLLQWSIIKCTHIYNNRGGWWSSLFVVEEKTISGALLVRIVLVIKFK